LVNSIQDIVILLKEEEARFSWNLPFSAGQANPRKKIIKVHRFPNL